MAKIGRWLADSQRHVFLPVILGIVSTLLYYSGFGAGNHVEQLPAIIRLLDHTYLPNDFFTNAAVASTARLYFSKFAALLAGSEDNLPLVFFTLTLISNVAQSVITCKFANDLFGNSPQAGSYASALVMSVWTFELAGLGARSYSTTFVPATLAGPFVLAAIWLFIRGRVIAGMILSGVASIFHPLIGLEIGGILLVTFFVFNFFGKRKKTGDFLQTGVAGFLILFVASLFLLRPQFLQPNIDPDLFIYIIAYFRHPHHYVPSSFSLADYVDTVAFCGATIALFFQWEKRQRHPYSLAIAIMACVIFLLCLGGYVFVEIFPLRLWVIAQTFRLLFVVKWIGLVLVAGALTEKNLPGSTKMLYMAGSLHPFSLGVAVLSQALREWLARNLKWLGEILDPSLMLLVVIALLARFSMPASFIILFGFYVLLILAFDTLPQTIFRSALLLSALLAIAVIFNHSRLPFISQSDWVRQIRTNLAFRIKSELGPAGDEVAKYARKNTPEGSIFLTPPRWGQFRLLARRAIVVDFKAFPFMDAAMAEWYDRLTDCYGNPSETGFAMIGELEKNYGNMDDSTLLSLREKYNISYAVLYAHTPTNFEIVFQNRQYKVVRLDENY